MAISNDQKVDYLFKKLGFAVSKTDVNSIKSAANESIPSPLLIRGDKVWQQSADIPTTIPGSDTAILTVYGSSNPIECTSDITASANRTWKTDLTDWVPPEFGSTYLVSVYVHTSGDGANAVDISNKVFVTGSGNDDEWFFDYQSGVLHFIGDNLPNGVNFSGKSVYITGARYTGTFGVGSAAGEDATLGNLTISDTTISTVNSGDDIILEPTSDGTVIINTNTALQLPTGTNSERPTAPVEGQIRYNEDSDKVEVYDGVDWITVGSTSGAVSTEAFSGDGSTTDFTLNSSADSATVMVTLNGVVQEPTVAYTVSNTTLSFTEAPSATDRIEVRKLGLLTTIRSVVDSDSDTSIQVESSPDEDVVRITAGGTNTLSISSSYIRADSGYTPSNNYDLATKTYVDSSLSSTASQTYVDNAINNLIDTAPGALDTLNELAAALGDDANFSTTVNTALADRLSATATVTLIGDVTGTASFSANTATITTTIEADSVVLGTDTVGNYVSAGATSGSGISGSVSSEGGTFTVTSNATSANTPSTIVFRDSSGNFSAGTITATSTQAQYADLAELYLTDEEYEPGTVVIFGGGKEVTACFRSNDKAVAGVISTNPAHLMNADLEGGTPIALTGRVPVKVIGEVHKGDLLVTSTQKGCAMVNNNATAGTILGKAISYTRDGGTVEALIILG